MDTKPQIRAAIRAQRQVSGNSNPDGFASQLATLVRELGAKRVSCFVSVRGEPDTSGFFAWALEAGIEVLLPRVVSETEMEWALLTRDALVPGAFGVPEPTGPAVDASVVETIDLMLIPAAAVDRRGTRLGWGRGYFDRELASIHLANDGAAGDASCKPLPVYAVVFDREIFDELPAEPHDVPVTGAVSEAGTYRFG